MIPRKVFIFLRFLLNVTFLLNAFLSAEPAAEKSISFKESLIELPLAVKKLSFNYTFLLISLEESCETIILAGFGAFLPKIIESQFTVSSATAALILGELLNQLYK